MTIGDKTSCRRTTLWMEKRQLANTDTFTEMLINVCCPYKQTKDLKKKIIFCSCNDLLFPLKCIVICSELPNTIPWPAGCLLSLESPTIHSSLTWQPSELKWTMKYWPRTPWYYYCLILKHQPYKPILDYIDLAVWHSAGCLNLDTQFRVLWDSAHCVLTCMMNDESMCGRFCLRKPDMLKLFNRKVSCPFHPPVPWACPIFGWGIRSLLALQFSVQDLEIQEPHNLSQFQ